MAVEQLSERAWIRVLEGEVSRYRRAIVEARNLLMRKEHVMPTTSVERDALTILCNALSAEKQS